MSQVSPFENPDEVIVVVYVLCILLTVANESKWVQVTRTITWTTVCKWISI